MIVVRLVLACLALSVAACASAPPPPPDLGAPPRKAYDAKTQLETGRRY
jgi:hypothetical protein